MLEPQPPRPQANKCWEAGGESGQRRRDGGQLLSQKGLTGEITAVVNPHSFETSFRYDFFLKGGGKRGSTWGISGGEISTKHVRGADGPSSKKYRCMT